jgi:hypothetical protein
MELTESIESLNQRLIDHFGIDSDTGRAIFRIVFSDEQTEKRLVDCLDSGIALLFPEVREVKKYPYIKACYVLERLVVVPDINEKELPVSKLSYEPLWVFCDQQHNALPPIWAACKFVIDSVYAALGKKSLAKYKDDEKNTTPEGREERIKGLEEELFGDESGLYGKTTPEAGEGIVVPSTYKSTQES